MWRNTAKSYDVERRYDARVWDDPAERVLMTAIEERRSLSLAPDASICPACASGCHDAPEGTGPFKCDCACHGRKL